MDTIDGARELGHLIRFSDPSTGGVIIFDRTAWTWSWHATVAAADEAMLRTFYRHLETTLRSALGKGGATR